MTPDSLSRRTILFVNIAHTLDHFILLIYPTAVIAIAAERGLDYGTLIGLATGTFVAFGVCSLPVGWIAGWIGRRNMLAIYFAGYGASCFGMASAGGSVSLAIWLLVLGVFSAIYHPVGSTMLVAHARRLGRTLGWNGVWGNLGAASASGVTALIAASFGWRAAFVVPGAVCIIAGLCFIALVPGDGDGVDRREGDRRVIPVLKPAVLIAAFAIAIVGGGMTFNMTTIALPKIIDERIGLDLPLALTGSLATFVFLFGGMSQLLMGNLVDRFSLPTIFVLLAALQPLGLGLAMLTTGIPLLLGLVLAAAAIFGQVVVNDAIVGRYVPADYRARAFSIRYFVGFTVAGLAVPMIAMLHGAGGFVPVLAAATIFGLAVFVAAGVFLMVAGARPLPVAAE